MDERLRRRPLIGRGSELALLGELLRAVTGGVPAAVAIGGDAGCGKTRLLREFLETAPEDALVLLGTCYDGGDPHVPFAPLLEAFRSLPDDGTDPLSVTAGIGSRTAVFERVLTRLARLGRDRPVVLALEDLHLADRSTLDLVAFLVANLRATSTLLVATWCSEKLPGAADLRHYVAQLATGAGVTRLDLAPLRRADLARILADARGAHLDAAVEVAIWKRAEGNPFYGLELLAAMQGCRPDDPAPALPETLADLMLARLDGLGPRARHVVRVAAAGGRRVDHRLLAGAAELPPAELFPALREAVEQQVLVPAGDGEEYRFRHALLHEAVYSQLLPGERQYILRRYAAGLADPDRTRIDLSDVVPTPRAPRLTPRELEVLSLLASGESNREIARALFISEKTASVHVSNILAKLGARSRTAAAATAHRLGVLR